MTPPRTTPQPARRDGALARLADAAFLHRRRVVVAWLAVLAIAIAAVAAFGGTATVDYSTAGSGSKAAAERLATSFGGRSEDQVDLVWRAPQGAAAPAVRRQIDGLLQRAERLPAVADGATAHDAEVSADGRTAVVRLALERPAADVSAHTGEGLRALVEGADGPDLQVAASAAVPGLTAEPSMSAELVGVAVAAVVLLLVFGSAVSAGLPLLVALFGVGVAVLFGGVLMAVVDTPDWAMQVSLMIGIGVGIDYALLILIRYRTALHGGKAPREANVEAMTTAGHSVRTAGATVVVSLMGLFLMRLPYLNGVALASSLAVLVVLAATVTLLPALIGMLGHRIDRLQVLNLGRAPADPDAVPSATWARGVQHRPVLATLLALVVLGALASPLTGIRFGFPDDGNDAASTTTRQAYDLIADGFGPGANGPLIAVSDARTGEDRAELARVVTAIRQDPQVAAVAAPVLNPAGDTAMTMITPRGAPQSAETTALVQRLRDGVLERSPLQVDVGGATAAAIDQGEITAQRLPLFIGGVVLLAFVLLLGAFRAPLIALKAGVLNILSIAAAYGVVSLVAEGGWAGQLVGIDTELPVPPFIPVMMFAVLFGLSMDYEVFLVSRIREERERLGNASAAIVAGVARTAKVITAAAAIMVAVFGAFALSPDVMLKLIGIGLATAILIDATIVRMLLVPAMMRLMGERAWWTPRILRARGQHDDRAGAEAPLAG
jgi:RND superfamily putative drug exporter